MNAAMQIQLSPPPSHHTRAIPVGTTAADVHGNSGRIIGALFLGGFVTYGTGALLTTSAIDTRDVVGSVSAHSTSFLIGAVLMLTVAAIDIGKALLFFPLLGRRGGRTALTYLSAMVVEVTILAVGVLALMSIVPLGDEVRSGVTTPAVGQSLGTLAVDVNGLAYQTGQATVAIGAFSLCLFLYRSRMIPRFLAVWGIIGYLLHFTGATAELFGLHISMFLLIPGGLFELAFGTWLLVKGLEPLQDRRHPQGPLTPQSMP